MAKLLFIEKQLIETVFGMSGGYVLDFSNREFEEFMKDVVPYNIYQRYPGMSKAKMLRKFIEDETDVYVGKMIILLINYMKSSSKDYGVSIADINKLYELGKNKLRKRPKTNNESNIKIEDNSTINYEMLKKQLLDIEKLDSQQKKGYAFERYLTVLMNEFSLEPKASYRTEHDQIDGSFMLNGNTILIEAKYRNTPIDKDALILFSSKIERKSPFTRGVFITFSKLSDQAIHFFEDKSSRFIVITVDELFLLCEREQSLKDLLVKKFRYLDETGCIYRHIMYL
ncbi:MAG: restriction endonuclease [Bacteroidales bacterium]|jgi:hypothetical protein|nr:restriction endonuclease [Bacteroidales bacterium]